LLSVVSVFAVDDEDAYVNQLFESSSSEGIDHAITGGTGIYKCANTFGSLDEAGLDETCLLFVVFLV
jgi:hypothetical protein